MNTNVQPLETTAIEIDWAEAEWFQVWLKLARREYQGRYDVEEHTLQEDPPMAA